MQSVRVRCRRSFFLAFLTPCLSFDRFFPYPYRRDCRLRDSPFMSSSGSPTNSINNEENGEVQIALYGNWLHRCRLPFPLLSFSSLTRVFHLFLISLWKKSIRLERILGETRGWLLFSTTFLFRFFAVREVSVFKLLENYSLHGKVLQMLHTKKGTYISFCYFTEMGRVTLAF